MLGAEDRFAGQYADDIDAQSIPQFVVHLPKHLIRLDDFDAVTGIAQNALAQAMHNRHADPSDKGGAKINTDAVRLTVVQDGLESLAAGHG